MTQRDMSAYALGTVFEYQTGTFSFRTGADEMAVTCALGAVSAHLGDGCAAARLARCAAESAEKPAYPQPKAAIGARIFLTPASAVRLDYGYDVPTRFALERCARRAHFERCSAERMLFG